MTTKRESFWICPALLLALSMGCKKNEPAAPPPPAEPAPAPAPAPAPEAAKPAEPAPAPEAAKPAAAAANPSLMEPSKLTEQAPAKFKAKFTTSVGDFVVEVQRDWAPNGADRFYNLVKSGFFDGARFFRAIKGFMVQFGIHGDPQVAAAWRDARITDDPVKQSNKRGMVTFATAGPNTRTTQLFINFADNTQLDGMGFAPFGKIAGNGMTVVDKINTEYGEGAPGGRGPHQGRIQAEGNAYLEREFPKLDYIKSAKIVK